IIGTRIAPLAAEIIGAPPEHLLPSETNPEVVATLPWRRSYDRSFNWAAFFAAPLVMTIMYVARCTRETDRVWDFTTPAPWVAIVVIVIAGHVVVLLWRHA